MAEGDPAIPRVGNIAKGMGRILAHELGHMLFIREDSSGKITDDDPDNHDPGDPGHSLTKNDLMNSSVPNLDITPILTGKECEFANGSFYTRDANILFGYTPAKQCTKVRCYFVALNPLNGGIVNANYHFQVNGVQQDWSGPLIVGVITDLTKVLKPYDIDVTHRDSFEINVWGDNDEPGYKAKIVKQNNDWGQVLNTVTLSSSSLTTELAFVVICTETDNPSTVPIDAYCKR